MGLLQIIGLSAIFIAVLYFFYRMHKMDRHYKDLK